MTLHDIIINCETYSDFSFVYAKRQNDKFSAQSEALVLVLDESEMEINTTEIARRKCLGYDYFLEIFIIQDMFRDLKGLVEYKSDKKKVERIIYYAEKDA